MSVIEVNNLTKDYRFGRGVFCASFKKKRLAFIKFCTKFFT